MCFELLVGAVCCPQHHLISENLAKADLATGIAGLGIASTSNLGGAVLYTSSDPHQDLGVTANGTVVPPNL